MELTAGQTGTLTNTDISVELIEVHGVRAGCFDCPVAGKLRVRSKAESMNLEYSFSGNMMLEALQKAKRKTAFGYIFAAVKISDAGFTFRVERPPAQGASPKP